MLESFWVCAAAGSVFGYLAALGIGGGSLLILWLTVVLQLEQATARAINLMFFIAAAGAVSLFRWKQGQLELKRILPGILFGCIFAFFGSLISRNTDVDILKKLFGFLLLATGIKEILYKPRKKEG